MPNKARNLTTFLKDFDLDGELAYSVPGQVAIPQEAIDEAQKVILSMAGLDEISAIDKAKKVSDVSDALSLLGRLFHQQKRARNGLFNQVGLPNLVPVAARQQKPDTRPQKRVVEEGVEKRPEEEQSSEEQADQEEEASPEEEAPVPGGESIAPAAAPMPSGPKLAGTPDTTDTEEGRELGEEDARARQLSQDKRQDQLLEQQEEEEQRARQGSREERVPEAARGDMEGSQVAGAEAQKIARRELESQRREAGLGGKKEKTDKSWEERMVKALAMGPIPGNLYFFWLAVADMAAIFVGEIFEFTASLGYINLHAFIDLLPFKVAVPWGEGRIEFDELSWREWMFVGIVDLVAIVSILIILAFFIAVIQFIQSPWILAQVGYAELMTLFFSVN